jgi:conjugative transfer signal peptidase TraF
MPKGLYYLSHTDIIKLGDIVYFPIPIEVKSLVVNERKWLGKDCCLMKKVAAIEDDFACINGSSLRIRDVTGVISSLDSLGRPLPSISYCGLLKKGELFVGDITNPKSFDSRYFGPIDMDQVMGVARPIWTF